jgi:hypothetical protein
MTAPPVLLSSAPRGYLIDAGVVVIGSSLVLVGNSVGGITFNPGDETRHVEFDGRRAEIRNQHRNIGGAAVIEGRFLIGSDASMISSTPGAESDGSDGVNTITPIDNDIFWPDGAYQENGLYLARRQDNKVFGVRMPVFYMKTTGFQAQDKSETGWALRITPVIDDPGDGSPINLSATPWHYLSADDLDELSDYIAALEA